MKSACKKLLEHVLKNNLLIRNHTVIERSEHTYIGRYDFFPLNFSGKVLKVVNAQIRFFAV